MTRIEQYYEQIPSNNSTVLDRSLSTGAHRHTRTIHRLWSALAQANDPSWSAQANDPSWSALAHANDPSWSALAQANSRSVHRPSGFSCVVSYARIKSAWKSTWRWCTRWQRRHMNVLSNLLQLPAGGFWHRNLLQNYKRNTTDLWHDTIFLLREGKSIWKQKRIE